MIKAIVFDFDGVVVDSEPVHLKAFQKVVKQIGIDLTEEDYFEKYLAYDDKTFFYMCLNDNGKYENKKQIEDLIDIKSGVFDALIKNNIKIFPGVAEFIKSIDEKYRVAIGSGALRKEIEDILGHVGLESYFEFIVSADEVANCKPDPEVYMKVLGIFNENSSHVISPDECVVFEDAQHGVDAAKSSGMNCIAVTNSNPETDIKGADYIINSFEEIDLNKINSLFGT